MNEAGFFRAHIFFFFKMRKLNKNFKVPSREVSSTVSLQISVKISVQLIFSFYVLFSTAFSLFCSYRPTVVDAYVFARLWPLFAVWVQNMVVWIGLRWPNLKPITSQLRPTPLSLIWFNVPIYWSISCTYSAKYFPGSRANFSKKWVEFWECSQSHRHFYSTTVKKLRGWRGFRKTFISGICNQVVSNTHCFLRRFVLGVQNQSNLVPSTSFPAPIFFLRQLENLECSLHSTQTDMPGEKHKLKTSREKAGK